MNNSEPRTGHCACGGITFKFQNEVKAAVNCHCEDCRRASGSAFASVLIVPKESFSVTSGEPSNYETTARSGAIARRFFCPRCGSPLFGESCSKPEAMIIQAGALDDSSEHIPMVAIFTADLPDWAKPTGSIAKYEGSR